MEQFPTNNPENIDQGPTDTSEEKPLSFSEHMAAKQNYEQAFKEAQGNGTLPEGVRDPQDYQEYLEEQKHRLQESSDFIRKSYAGVDEEAIKSLISSKEFKKVIENGVSMPDLARAGLIYFDTYGDAPGYNRKEYTLNFDVIGAIYNNIECGEPYLGSCLKTINCLKERQPLDIHDLAMVTLGEPDDMYKNRILYGDGGGKRAQETFDTVKKHPDNTWFLFDFLSYTARQYDDNYFTVDADDVRISTGELFRDNIDNILDLFDSTRDLYSDFQKTRACDLILRSVDTTTIIHQHDWHEVGLSEEDILESVYCWDRNHDPSDKSFREQEESSYHLFEDIEVLETRGGFSRDSIINTIHDNNLQFPLYTIESMREYGISDADIAYASNAHLKYSPELAKEGKSPWGRYEHQFKGVNFSESDLLAAAIREIRNQQ